MYFFALRLHHELFVAAIGVVYVYASVLLVISHTGIDVLTWPLFVLSLDLRAAADCRHGVRSLYRPACLAAMASPGHPGDSPAGGAQPDQEGVLLIRDSRPDLSGHGRSVLHMEDESSSGSGSALHSRKMRFVQALQISLSSLSNMA